MDMDDQRIVRGTTFRSKNRKDSIPIQRVCAEAVNGFGRKGYESSFFQDIGGEGISIL